MQVVGIGEYFQRSDIKDLICKPMKNVYEWYLLKRNKFKLGCITIHVLYKVRPMKVWWVIPKEFRSHFEILHKERVASDLACVP